MTEQQTPDLRTLSRALSAGDLSVLSAALQELRGEAPVLVTTATGSANDLLWSAMLARGWMSAAEPLDTTGRTKVFQINPGAKESIREFLADCHRSEAMTQIINQLRADIAPKLIDTVRGVDGTPADLAIMLAAIVESTMRGGIKPHLHDEFLQEVFRVAKRCVQYRVIDVWAR